MKNRLIILLASAIVAFAICGCSSTSSADPAAEEPLIEVTADDEQEDAMPADSDMIGEAIEDTIPAEVDAQGLSDSNLPKEVAPTTDTVQSTDIVNIREQANTDSAILGKAAIGETFTRYEASDNGWSRIDYNGSEAYIKTEYLEPFTGDSSSESSVAAAVVSTPATATADVNNNGAATGTGDSNFNTYNNADQQKTATAFVLNTSSMKIHYPSCYSVKKIAPQNYSTSDLSLEELKGQGYTTCGNCFK